MKYIYTVFIIIILAVAVRFIFSSSTTSGNALEIYTAMRNLALSLTAEEAGIDHEKDEVYGVLVDIGRGNNNVTTIISLADGTTSMYMTGGGGIIGAGQDEQCAAASKRLVAEAQRQRKLLVANWEDTTLGYDEIRFIALTPKGPIAATAKINELTAGSQPLSPLYYVADDVLTALRLLQ